MPMYDYKCTNCFKVFEQYHPLSKYKIPEQCPECGNYAKKLIKANIIRDEPAWIDSVNETINDGFMDKVQTRTHMKRILKQRGFSQVG